MGKVILKPSREKSVLRRHPWIFSGAIKNIESNRQSGETVEVFSANGKLLGKGSYSPHSQIQVRVWTFDPAEEINTDFFHERIRLALKMRDGFFSAKKIAAYRIINSESDGIPGLIVDRYGDFLVCQFLSAGAEFWKTEIVEQLQLLVPCKGIYNRSDADIRSKEGLQPMSGTLWGEEPPELVEIEEAELRMLVDIKNGHKTGLYLDQRENRMAVAEFSNGKNVLNCFAYTGGFALWALHGGAEKVVNIESSASLLSLAQKNIEINGFDSSKVENIAGDVFQILRKFRDEGKQFDVIILDPPKFAESASQIQKASRGYKDINLLALKLLKAGGFLFTFSCSGHISHDLFQKIVADAALDAGKNVQIIRFLSQAVDHPVALNFPEGRYLKGLVCNAH
ncbi:class I SAM-dependent methyltransferase [candidate division KSB1 bacterium]|nr:class I SAM-dependent methyltransferase [candidate division KSB1 bacterium]